MQIWCCPPCCYGNRRLAGEAQTLGRLGWRDWRPGDSSVIRFSHSCCFDVFLCLICLCFPLPCSPSISLPLLICLCFPSASTRSPAAIPSATPRLPPGPPRARLLEDGRSRAEFFSVLCPKNSGISVPSVSKPGGGVDRGSLQVGSAPVPAPGL